MKTTVGERVEKWLRQSAGQCFCDVCIASGIGTDLSAVCNLTKRLGTKSYSSKYRGRCASCKNVKLVTIVNGSSF
jgi:hypothetical protein